MIVPFIIIIIIIIILIIRSFLFQSKLQKFLFNPFPIKIFLRLCSLFYGEAQVWEEYRRRWSPLDEKFRIKPCLLQCVSSGKRAKNCFFLSHTEILLLLQVFYIITMLNAVLNFPHASSSSVLTTRTVSFQSSNVLDSLPADTHMMPFCTWCISSPSVGKLWGTLLRYRLNWLKYQH